MGTSTLAAESLLPEAELARVAKILARYLAGRQAAATGSQTVRRVATQGLDFLDFREYQHGDDARSIDWRASARSRGVQVRRYCADVASDWYLCVDSSASMGIDGGANWLLARKLAAALSYILLHLGHRVGVLLFSSEIDAACAPGRGYPQYARILRTLHTHGNRAGGGGSDPGACAAVVGRHHSLMIISDFLAEDAMVSALARLRASQRQLHLFQLDGAPDWPPPDGSSLLLEDVESGAVRLCGDTAAALTEASVRLAQLQRDLSAWGRRFNIPHTLCHADDNWRELLLRHFIEA